MPVSDDRGFCIGLNCASLVFGNIALARAGVAFSDIPGFAGLFPVRPIKFRFTRAREFPQIFGFVTFFTAIETGGVEKFPVLFPSTGIWPAGQLPRRMSSM
jgi:hypothetical protein